MSKSSPPAEPAPRVDHAETVAAYFAAMRQGEQGKTALLALFHDDARYTEPFDGSTRTHRGKAEIGAMLDAAMQQRPPDLVLNVHQVDIDGDTATAIWSCESPIFPQPIRGRDVYEIVHGQIAALTTEFLD